MMMLLFVVFWEVYDFFSLVFSIFLLMIQYAG